jgi:excisionase family DNA binding protein
MTVLTVRQAAERLQVAPTTIYSLCARKQLTHVRIGTRRGTIRIPEASLDAFMAGATIRSGGPAERSPRRAKLKHLKL